MRRLTRLTVVVLLAVVGVFAGTGGASATAAPTPENPNSSGISVLAAPNPLPPDAPFNPFDLLTYYGTAGPSFHAYTDGMNFIESAIAEGGVNTANFFFSIPKTLIAIAAAVANWVFNPSGFVDQLAGPADQVSKSLADGLAKPWMPILILISAAIAVWGARTGKIGTVLNRVLFTIIGVTFFASAYLSPASLAGKFTGLVSDTAASVLAPVPDGMDPATAKATVGTRMLGPIWKAAVYDPWLTGTLGSSTSNTARYYGPGLFQDSAMTWREVAKAAPNYAPPDNASGMPQNVPGNTTDPKTLQDVTGTPNVARTPEHPVVPDPLAPILTAKQADFDKLARDISISDKAAYEALQGKSGYGNALFMSTVVTLCTLPILLLALIAVLAAYLALFMTAAAWPVIGLAVGAYPKALEKVAKMVAGFLIDAVLAAVAARIVITVVGVLLAWNTWFGALLSLAGSVLAWRALRKARGFQYSASAGGFGLKVATTAVGAATGGVGYVAGSWKATRDANKAAEEKEAAEKQMDGAPPEMEALPAPESAPESAPRPAGLPQPEFYIPEGVASMAEYRSRHGTTATTSGRAVVIVGQPGDEDDEVPTSATADRAATPSGHQQEVPHPDDPEQHSYAMVQERRRPVAERVIFNPATGRNERVEDGAPSVVIARADTPTEETA